MKTINMRNKIRFFILKSLLLEIHIYLVIIGFPFRQQGVDFKGITKVPLFKVNKSQAKSNPTKKTNLTFFLSNFIIQVKNIFCPLFLLHNGAF